MKEISKKLLSFLQEYSLNGDITDPESLENLCTNEEKLESFPAEIAGLTSLKTIYFPDNYLESLPAEIRTIKSLVSLHLQNNELKTLPEGFGELKSLEYLYLENNQLETLPEDFGELESLKHLNLENNQLKTLPKGFGKLKLLEMLNISANSIESFPKEILELKSLEYINISNNRLLTVSNWSHENVQVEIKEYYSPTLESFPVNISDYFLNLSTLILSNKDKLQISIGESEMKLKVSFGHVLVYINEYQVKWQECKKVVEALLINMTETLTGLVIEYSGDFQPLKIKPECIKFSSITLDVTGDGASMQPPGPESKETTPKP